MPSGIDEDPEDHWTAIKTGIHEDYHKKWNHKEPWTAIKSGTHEDHWDCHKKWNP